MTFKEFFGLFKKPVGEKLPEYPRLGINEILPASTILFYGGNKLTEAFGNNLYHHPYIPPAFHAAVYIEDGLFLNVGKFRTLESLTKECRSTRRVDIITYSMDLAKRNAIRVAALKDTSQPKVGLSLPDYAWTDYLRFGFKRFHPSKNDFCSENCVELFGKAGVIISDRKAVDTAPWHLLEYALAHPDTCHVHTLWIGPDYKYK